MSPDRAFHCIVAYTLQNICASINPTRGTDEGSKVAPIALVSVKRARHIGDEIYISSGARALGTISGGTVPTVNGYEVVIADRQ